ncbi:hypothetical protein V6N11_068446 [Hibiscus sabdariffa]
MPNGAFSPLEIFTGTSNLRQPPPDRHRRGQGKYDVGSKLKEFLCFTEAEVGSLASLYAGGGMSVAFVANDGILTTVNHIKPSLFGFYIDRVDM